MSVASETLTPDGLVVGAFPVITDTATLLSGQNVDRGTVLGKITSGGKLKTSLSASDDGSQVPYAIAAEAKDASGGDKSILIYLSGEFDSAKLTIGTGHTAASIKDGLRDKSIYLRSTSANS